MKSVTILGHKIPIIGTVGDGGKVTFFEKENQMQFTICENPGCGWYVYDNTNDKYLHKNLKFYGSTYGSNYGYGSAPGYYNSERKAKLYLRLFLRKSNMNDLIVIQVEVNGKKVPLHEISEQTLLTVRENSKPKEIPVARAANFHNSKRLILKVSDSIKERINNGAEVIAIDLRNGDVVGHWSLANDNHGYNGVSFYDDVKTIE